LLSAHHFDNSCESFLLEILTGVPISNIRSMQSVLELEDDNTLLVRPPCFVSLRKQDHYDHLRSNGFIWREDESNAETKYQRNKVRNQLILLFEKFYEAKTVPLEQREYICVVILGNRTNDVSCVAVEVNNEWMVHAD
jgi:tRNA(Ile)-lysidine synthase TilS/MesJ